MNISEGPPQPFLASRWSFACARVLLCGAGSLSLGVWWADCAAQRLILRASPGRFRDAQTRKLSTLFHIRRPVVAPASCRWTSMTSALCHRFFVSDYLEKGECATPAARHLRVAPTRFGARPPGQESLRHTHRPALRLTPTSSRPPCVLSWAPR